MDHNVNVWQCVALERKLLQKVKNALDCPGTSFMKRLLHKMGNFRYGLNLGEGIPNVPVGCRYKTWRGVARTGKQCSKISTMGEYQYFLLYKENDIRAPSGMISSGDWASYFGSGTTFYTGNAVRISLNSMAIYLVNFLR